MEKQKEIEVCPNCGLILQGSNFLISTSNMSQNISPIGPIFGRFLCPKCNYSGLPVEMNIKDYNKAKFENKRLSLPLSRANPQPLKITILAIIIMVVAFFINNLTISTILVLISVIIAFYAALRINKFKNN